MTERAAVAGSSPYPWPFDGRIDPAHIALVICGAMGHWADHSPLDPTVESNIDRLRSVLAGIGALTVLLHHDGVRVGPVATVPERLCPELAAGTGEIVVTAAGNDGFYGSRLDAELARAGRSHLILVGRGFETAVHSTLRRANDRGYECLTVTDACTSIDPALTRASISTIEMSGGIFGAVATAQDTLTALTTAPPYTSADPKDQP